MSPEMALRLEKALGRSAESWLALQYNHDLWHAKKRIQLRGVTKVRLTAPERRFVTADLPSPNLRATFGKTRAVRRH